LRLSWKPLSPRVPVDMDCFMPGDPPDADALEIDL
jgi:hypothetical protein